MNRIKIMALTTVVKIPVPLDLVQPDNPMMAIREKTPAKYPTKPMILGVFSSLWVTSLGFPSVVANKIFVMANTVVRNPPAEVVASFKIIFKSRLSDLLIRMLAVTAIENPPRNTEMRMNWLESLFQYSKGNSAMISIK